MSNKSTKKYIFRAEVTFSIPKCYGKSTFLSTNVNLTVNKIPGIGNSEELEMESIKVRHVLSCLWIEEKRFHPKIPKPKISKPKILKVQNTQGQNNLCPDISKANIPKI